jgi:DNA/RNA endonuclease G (NUC1)
MKYATRQLELLNFGVALNHVSRRLKMAHFEGQVRAEWLVHSGPDRSMRLLEAFAFVDDNGVRWDAPTGSVIDGASIPDFLWSATVGTPFVGDFRRASVLHDVACQQRTRPHTQVHRMFYDAMVVDGVDVVRAESMYTAVRLFGPRWTVAGAGAAAPLATPAPVEPIGIDRLERALDVALGEEATGAQAGAAAHARLPAPLIVVEMALAQFEGSRGYDPRFLGPRIDLPRLPPQLQADLAPLLEAEGHELKYTHFSVLMSKSRRLAYFTAVNIDGNQLRAIEREDDRWYFDPRIAREHQAGPELYAQNDLDRGHLVRRLDPVWGRRARQANEETFHFTNAAPQHQRLNQRTWLGLEEYILQNARQHDLKVSVFTGPVFRADDMLYRGQYRIPAEFWKVAVMVKEDGQLSATAYLQTQKNLLVSLAFAFGEYKTYQVPVSQIEALTGLDFGDLRTHDPLTNGVAAAASGVRIVNSAEDIRF